MILAAYFVGVNALSFAMLAEDKASSKGWIPFLGRIPEALLHQVELAGGSPGSFLGQRVFRHKISKLAYQRGFSQVLAVQIAASIAWGYFHGPSWALLGVGLAPVVMFAATARRMNTLKHQESTRNRWNQPWQRPVDVSSSARRRRNTDIPKRATPFK
ncbi:unnamed protein product [Ectocarpus sp. 8 AP-2014]